MQANTSIAEVKLQKGLVLPAYIKEWKTGKKGDWCLDENNEPKMSNAVDITEAERDAVLEEVEAINSSPPDYNDPEFQMDALERLNELADSIVSSPTVLNTGMSVLILVAKPDHHKGLGMYMITA
jgi:hypothetical protein